MSQGYHSSFLLQCTQQWQIWMCKIPLFVCYFSPQISALLSLKNNGEIPGELQGRADHHLDVNRWNANALERKIKHWYWLWIQPCHILAAGTRQLFEKFSDEISKLLYKVQPIYCRVFVGLEGPGFWVRVSLSRKTCERDCSGKRGEHLAPP